MFEIIMWTCGIGFILMMLMFIAGACRISGEQSRAEEKMYRDELNYRSKSVDNSLQSAGKNVSCRKEEST